MKKLYTIILMLFVIASQGQNKLLSSIEQNYNNGIWENAYGNNYEYDSNNNLVSETFLEWKNGAWKILGKSTYTYNASNKVILEIGQKWNSITNVLENEYRDTYTYTNGNFTGQVAQIWENAAWINEWKFDITYNSSSLPISSLSYNWNNSQWVSDSRTTVTYNANNRPTTDIGEKWINAQWINNYKATFNYNANNKLLDQREFDWNEVNNAWDEAYRTDYVLDTSGNRIIETNSGNYQYKDEYSYDTSNQMSTYVHPFKDKTGIDYFSEDFPYVNKISVINGFSYDSNSNTFTNTSRTTYNYNNAITLETETLEIANSKVTVFPNPTTSVLNINFSETVTIDKIVIVDVTGRVVLQEEANKSQINVEKLAAGLYIIEVYSGNEKFTSKFIKE
ncbi:T9SS type A sorting domain-containing protein [Flavobacterium eburneipallidum]|uniref:T9SS type A sorting domain-containing protein n=1 Tax=Flavobacterium eburneipallidum TaxID=3003263 RepID=UPI00248231B0|nr:T9SS type A sorting domain-containing protein [Flavobacterium eburneipallidum]